MVEHIIDHAVAKRAQRIPILWIKAHRGSPMFLN
jgi:hypothetical protein